MITEAEIYTRVTALHSALVEKLGAQPYLGETTINIGSTCFIGLWDKSERDGGTGKVIHRAVAPTIAACLADAEAFVAAMPDPDAKARANWHSKLADVIDEGHALALPDEVMAPLRAGSQAMTENLIAGPAS